MMPTRFAGDDGSYYTSTEPISTSAVAT